MVCAHSVEKPWAPARIPQAVPPGEADIHAAKTEMGNSGGGDGGGRGGGVSLSHS